MRKHIHCKHCMKLVLIEERKTEHITFYYCNECDVAIGFEEL
jgi:hypothetical protein